MAVTPVTPAQNIVTIKNYKIWLFIQIKIWKIQKLLSHML